MGEALRYNFSLRTCFLVPKLWLRIFGLGSQVGNLGLGNQTLEAGATRLGIWGWENRALEAGGTLGRELGEPPEAGHFYGIA